MIPSYRVEELSSHHDRQAFVCGVEALDRYLRETAGQDAKRLLSKCYAACPPECTEIAGFYTLAAAEILVTDLPNTVAKKLPRYPTVPVVRIGRLAIDHRYRGRGLGSALVIDAVARVLKADIAAFALTVDAKDAAAAGFYRRVGFLPLETAGRILILPLATARKAIWP